MDPEDDEFGSKSTAFKCFVSERCRRLWESLKVELSGEHRTFISFSPCRRMTRYVILYESFDLCLQTVVFS